MNQVKIYQILEQSGFSKENAQMFLEEIQNTDTNAATKGDLKDLEIRLLERLNKLSDQMNQQTWKFFGGISLVAFIFKIADIWMHR